jgi:hypothetical protein
MPAHHRRVDATRDVAQLLQRERDLAPRPIDASPSLGIEPFPQPAQLE